MILQALVSYYQRKATDPESGMEPEGFCWKPFPFIVVIDKEGHFVTLEDTRLGEEKKNRGRTLMVPRAAERSGSRSFETTNFLWDHVGYLIGAARSDEPKSLLLAKNQYASWLRFISDLPPILTATEEIRAVQKFYEKGQASRVLKSPNWPDCAKLQGCAITFRLEGNTTTVADGEHVFSYIAKKAMDRSGADPDGPDVFGRCIVTGETALLKRTHGKTAISKDSKALVSFQKNAGYDSYGKEQAYNAPTSYSAESAYTSALTSLLRTNRLQIGDATTVFWSDREGNSDGMEQVFSALFSTPSPDNPDRDIDAIRQLYSGIYTGANAPDSKTTFFVLGLAPSAYRIAVRFWHRSTTAELSTRLRQHFDDLAIDANQAPRLSLSHLLKCISTDQEIEKLPPKLGGEIVRAILEGTPYPETLLHQVIRRVRAEQAPKKTADNVPHARAALLKAYLNRRQRNRVSDEKEITVSLDHENMNPGYRLGRLFAALEKIQEDANPRLNATIRDRFYGAASANPVTVFPQLLKLANHHLKKIGNPRFVAAHQRRLADIMSGLSVGMPAHLRIEDQARFAIGYYHQRHALSAKACSEQTAASSTTDSAKN